MVCVACLVLKDDSALDEFVDAAADGAFVHQEHFAGCLAIQQEAVVLSDEGSVSSSVSGAGPSVKHYFRIIFPRKTYNRLIAKNLRNSGETCR